MIESDCDEVSGAHEIATVIGLDGREPEPTDKPVPFETLMPGSGSLVDQATKQNVSFGPGRAKREQSVVGAYITTGQNLANVPPGASASGLRWKYVIVAAAIGALSTILVARRWSVGTRHGRAND
ncbi:MAG: hypothetical protein K8T90_01685 [Planctomycetes bacterium]|nr:hypothetical protein [Planctomycetota bacterium]